MLRSAPDDELLGEDDEEEEGDAEERGDDVGRPEALRRARVVLVEVEDRAAEPVLDRSGKLPMIAPTTHAVAAILKAAKRYGSEAGTRSFQSTVHRLAAYEFMSSCARGSADWRPRRALIATGKKVR
jgi:hypothetical protein